METETSRLTESLEETLRALGRLQASIDRLRPSSNGGSEGVGSFPPAELDRLSAVVHRSSATLTRRIQEISPADEALEAKLAELWRRSSAGVPGDRVVTSLRGSDPHPRSLLVTYRAACRSLCTALQEVRRASDATTTLLLSGILQQLEKQLWLLDSSRLRARSGVSTIDLFLSC